MDTDGTRKGSLPGYVRSDWKSALLLFFMFTSVLMHGCDTGEWEEEDIFSPLLLLDAERVAEIDGIVQEYSTEYRYISLGIVREGEPVLIRCYGQDRVGRNDEYASVSKPVTSMITMMFLEEGRIGTLDDPIADYCEKYRDVLPDRYPDVEITFAHLLSHRSGIPHHERIWKDGKLDLAFEPGERFMYSTRGYGVLGEVLSEIAGKSFNQLVKDYIGKSAGAPTISCPLPFFEAPGGLIQSTISDMTLFASGVMNEVFVSDSILYQIVWKPVVATPDGTMAMGWYVYEYGSEAMSVYHAGSNGKPRAFMAIRPGMRTAVVLLGRNESSEGEQKFQELARRIMSTLIPAATE